MNAHDFGVTIAKFKSKTPTLEKPKGFSRQGNLAKQVAVDPNTTKQTQNPNFKKHYDNGFGF